MMRGKDVTGILFSSEHEERVRTLTQNRALASIPYGGRYRLVDFMLSNMVNSGINRVGIVTHENYQSLMDHLGSGKAWDLSRKNEGLSLLPPFGAMNARSISKIEALDSIRWYLKRSLESHVLLSNCDIVANIDYSKIYDFHSDKQADITVVYRRGASPDTDKNLVLTIDPEGRVREVYIKRGSDSNCNYGLGMWIISKDLLLELVEDCMSRNLYDFDRDLVQRCLPDLRIYGYEFSDVCYQISAFDTYFDANMALMDPKVRNQLFNPNRPIFTKVRDDMPTRYGLGSSIKNSMVAAGCIIDGEVENSLLFRGVVVKKGAKIRNCVVMQDSVVGMNSRLDYVVTDKNVVIEDNKTLMGHQTYPVFIEKGSKV